MKNRILFGMALAAALGFASGCTNKQGETEAPVFITVDMELQPGFINVADAGRRSRSPRSTCGRR